MTVCRYYQQGTCRFGDRCRFEHPGSTRDRYGGGYGGNDRNPFGALSSNNNNNSNKATQPAAQNAKDMSPQDTIKLISEEMKLWQSSGMWPLSCYAFTKEANCLPGFDDLSPEELRLEAYTAEKGNTLDQYRAKVTQTIQDYSNKKSTLSNPSNDVKQQLMQEILNQKMKSGSSGNAGGSTTSGTTSAFGGGTGTASVFGGQSGSNSTGGSAFGGTKSAFGSTNSAFGGSKSVFGGAGTNSVFGGSSSTGLFSQSNNSNTVGAAVAQPSGTASVFGGQPSGQASVFGGQSSGQASVFGGQSAGQASVFGGQSSGQASVFGGQSSASGGQASVFGCQSTGQASVFGGTSTGKASVFGNQTSGQSSVFGGQATGQPTTQTSSVFGSQPTNQASVFGSQPKAQVSVFGTPTSSLTQSATNNPTTAASSSNIQTAPVTVQNNTYTPLDQLTDEERQQFEAPKFTLGKIPIKPPPKELCV